MHSSQYDDGENWKGKRAIVIGTGNSGHDIAQDLHSSGADVTLVQRSSTLVVSIEPSAQLVYAPYNEGTLEDNDLIATSMPLALARKSHALTAEKSKELDKELLQGLERAGFKLDFGEGNTGWQFKYLTRGGGYYFNVGCSDLIAKGDIKLKQFADIDRFVGEGARMKHGESVAADLVVLATGYKRQEELVRKLFGDDVTDRVGTIWGFGEEQELRNMYTRTGQPGLWLIAGGLAQCRIGSKHLALQIKAIEEGLVAKGCWASPLLVIQDLPDDERFRVAPGLVVVAAEGNETIENDIPRLYIDNVEFCPLHQRAELVEAADQQIAGAGRLSLVEQLTGFDIANRTGVRRTIQGDVLHFSARRQIGAQRGFEFAQAPEVVDALIDDLAGGVDILDFGDRNDGRFALRESWPARTDATRHGGNQGKAARSQADRVFHGDLVSWRFWLLLHPQPFAFGATARCPASDAGSASGLRGSRPNWRRRAGRSARRRPALRIGRRESCRSPRSPCG